MPKPSSEKVLTQLETLCACKGLAQKASLQKLLRHVVVATLEGNSSALKELVIGIDVYGKFADWNPKNDATVRVAMSKLRKEVNAYYATDGMADSVLIVLEPGAYTPDFMDRKADAALPAPPIETVRPKLVTDAPKAGTPIAPAFPDPPPPQIIIIREVAPPREPETKKKAPDLMDAADPLFAIRWLIKKIDGE